MTTSSYLLHKTIFFCISLLTILFSHFTHWPTRRFESFGFDMRSEGLQMSYDILWNVYFLAIISLVRCEVSVDCVSKAVGGNFTSGLFLVDCTLSRNLHAEETVVWMSENCMVIGKCNSTVCNATAEVQLFTLAYIFGLSTTQSTETGPFIFSMYTTHNDSFLNSVKCSLNYYESTSSCVHGLACHESTYSGKSEY